jgi:hypothetical protein
MTRVLRWSMVICLATGCGNGGTAPNPGADPDTRVFHLGFSAVPPRPDQDAVLQGLDLWTRRADLAIVHEELPWTDLVAGVPPDSILAREKDGLIDYYRGRGLGLIFVADGTDGLARDQEAPQLRALGRSITEPTIRDLYRAYISAFVHRYHPDYVGLAAETNLTRAVGSTALYQGLVTAANAAASDLLADPAHSPLFVSVQVEVAWGKLVGSSGFVGVEQDLVDFPFVKMLGLSSYPYFVWPAPADLPDDYYARLVAGRSLPVMVVEGGWASSLSGTGFTTATQAAYLRRQAELLDRANGLGLIQLTFTDLDLTTYPADVQASLEPFAHLGLVDAQFQPKPALEVWDSLFALPLSR